MAATIGRYLTGPTAQPLGFSLSDYGLSASDATADAGLQQSRLLRDYGQSTNDLVNSDAANGSFYGGQIGVQSDRMKQGYSDQYGDVQRNLDRTLAGLRRAGVLAATGSSF